MTDTREILSEYARTWPQECAVYVYGCWNESISKPVILGKVRALNIPDALLKIPTKYTYPTCEHLDEWLGNLSDMHNKFWVYPLLCKL